MSASRVETMELWIWSCLLLRTCREYRSGSRGEAAVNTIAHAECRQGAI